MRLKLLREINFQLEIFLSTIYNAVINELASTLKIINTANPSAI